MYPKTVHFIHIKQPVIGEGPLDFGVLLWIQAKLFVGVKSHRPDIGCPREGIFHSVINSDPLVRVVRVASIPQAGLKTCAIVEERPVEFDLYL